MTKMENGRMSKKMMQTLYNILRFHKRLPQVPWRHCVTVSVYWQLSWPLSSHLLRSRHMVAAQNRCWEHPEHHLQSPEDIVCQGELMIQQTIANDGVSKVNS